MALTTLDPKPALIVIDLQKGFVPVLTVPPVGPVIDRAARVAAAFRRRGLPVVLVNVNDIPPGRTDIGLPIPDDPSWAELVDELDPQPTDHLITKKSWGAFHGTSLDARLRELGVTQVILLGAATSVSIESTARCAYEHGFHVVLVTDAMSDIDDRAHRNSTEHIFPFLGETTSTEEVLRVLETTATAPSTAGQSEEPEEPVLADPA